MAKINFGGSVWMQGAYSRMKEVKFGSAKATDLQDMVNKAQADASKVPAEKAASTMSSWFTKKGPNAVGIA